MSYPPGMCTETKPSAAETEPSAIGTEKHLGGFLISLWFELRDLRSLDPQVDNISRQSRGTMQHWKGTAHLHATVVQSQVFLCVKQCHYTLWRPSLSLETPSLQPLETVTVLELSPDI